MSVPPQRSRNEMGIYARFGSVSRPHEIRVEDNGYGSVKSLVDWLNNLFPYLNLPSETSEEELRDCLIDGTVLCSIVNKLRPGLIDMRANLRPSVDYLKRFLDAMDEMGLLRFVLEDIQQGYMLPVLQCLGTLKEHLENVDIHSNSRRRWNVHEVELSNRADLSQRDSSVSVERSAINDEEKQRNSTDGSHRSGLSGSDSSEPSPSLVHDAGNKLFEVLKQGSSTDCSDDNINELIKFSSMDNTSTHALFGFLNKILDESIDKNDGHVYHMARMLKQVVQVIEQRVSAQAENMKDQNSLCRVRSGKYQSRVKVFETIASESTEEIEVLFSHLKQLKIEKAEIEEKERLNEQDLVRLKEDKIFLENEKSALKHELETLKKVHEEHCLQLEAQTMQITQALGKKSRDLECSLTESKKRVKQLESFSESKFEGLKKKEETFRVFLGDQQRVLQELRTAYASIKQEVRMTKRKYAEQFYGFGLELEGVVHAAENYHSVLAENRKLYNEVQDLKGNIRVYCRVRPFLPGQCKKQTTIEYMGENGELLVSNPSKPGKDTHRMFKFNKVFGPAASQEEVFLDTRPLIRTVLDGFNVCIFAYGQTGSGKTYTMSGPNISSKEGWGVNYRALRDLFQIAQSRKGSVTYEIGVQMVEIYNEQVRDLLTYHGGQRRLGIWSTTQPNGLAVPDASMHQVISTEDVLELMNIGLMNRAVGATALNERSSRSHSILTIHVSGNDLESGTLLRGNLHLVDLAGSERVDRSEVTGERLREAQHINKSLSALGDVIFALAQKSQHVPYRNSKLTQVLQSSLGGQAKTLMFVQLNPDLDSYSETLSTLKFAERVSGVELGAARSNREGRDIRELVDQVTSLKQTIAKKDDEIERLQQLKVNVNGPRSVRIESSPRRYSIGNLQQSPKSPGRKTAPLSDKEMDICSENGERTSDAFSLQSMDELKRHKGHLGHSKPMIDLPAEAERAKRGLNSKEEAELFCVGGGDSDERVSDLSDGCLSMGTETDGSSGSGVECTQFPESAARPSEDTRQMEPAGSTQGTISSRIVNSVEATRRHGNSAQIARSTGAGSPAVGSERRVVTSNLPKPSQKVPQTRLSRTSLHKPAATTKFQSTATPTSRKPTTTAGNSSVTRSIKQTGIGTEKSL
ncbi:Kinesin-like protein KIN-14J [Linum perenne]